MVIQNTPTKIDKIASLRIGQRGENLATDIKMDVSDWITVHPDANYYCLFKRPDEVQVQPVLSSLEEDVLTWTVRAWECAVIGVGYLEVRAVNPDTGLVAKSRVIPCAIEDSVIDDEGPVPPEMSWVGEVLAAKDTAVAAKTAAEEARDTAQTTVNGAIAGIQAEGQTQIGAVQSEGATQVGNVNSAGQTQVGNVNAAGTTQVGNVNTAGSTQVGAVQAKGTEVLNSIPADYSTLSDDVSGLKGAITVSETTATLEWSQGTIKFSDGTNNTSTIRIRTGTVTASAPVTVNISLGSLFQYSYRIYTAGEAYDQSRSTETFITTPGNIILDAGESIRFVVSYMSNEMAITPETDTGFVCTLTQYTDPSLSLPNKSADAKAVGDRFADFTNIENKVNETIVNDYQLYNPAFPNSPSAIENNGNIITTLSGTKTSDYIDCSGWKGIRYTGSSWLVCRALAFYDENHTWILSYPATGDTTEYTNEIINIPVNAKYVIFADLTAKQAQTLRIEVATNYTTAGKWNGKKWTCVGDSLTEHNLRTTMNYHDYVADATGITVVNMGRSGTGYKRTYDEGYAFYQRISNVPTDSDVVTIFGSGNDLLYADNIGTPTDTFNSEDEAGNSLCACINHTIDILIGLMPTVQLGIVAPTPWKGEKPTLNNTNSMGRYVEALRQICYIRSIPFLDLYHESNLRPWTAEGRAACYSKDGSNGVHPNEAGHKIIASRFEGFLDSLLLAN